MNSETTSPFPFPIYLVKTDSDGNEIWSKTFGEGSSDYGRSVGETTDGGYIVTGSTRSYGAGASDVYLVKMDTDGNEVWSKTFGGSNDDYGYSVQQTTDGGYIIAGFKYPYPCDAFLIFYTKTFIWPVRGRNRNILRITLNMNVWRKIDIIQDSTFGLRKCHLLWLRQRGWHR